MGFEHARPCEITAEFGVEVGDLVLPRKSILILEACLYHFLLQVKEPNAIRMIVLNPIAHVNVERVEYHLGLGLLLYMAIRLLKVQEPICLAQSLLAHLQKRTAVPHPMTRQWIVGHHHK